MRTVWIGAAILVLAAALRIAGANSGGLWLDEIWSLQLAEDLQSPLAVLEVRQDNNHPLNTLVLAALAPGRGPMDFLVFRTPAVIAGVLATLLAGLYARRRGAAAACATMFVIATSSLMVQYGSEARGYAFTLLFATTGLLAIDRDDRRWRWCVAFNLSVLLGMLSHLSFAHVYAAILLWWLWSHRRRERSVLVREFLAWHALPILFTLLLYFLQARALPVAGGPEPEFDRLLARTGALALGFSGRGAWRWIGAATAVATASFAIARLARSGQDRWVLYAGGIFGVPALVLLLQQPEFLAPRYFLMSVLLFLLLLGELAGELLRGSRASQWVAVLLLVGFAIGNANETRMLLENGRGQYGRAMLYMAHHSRAPEVRIAADHDIRVGVVIGFYGRLLPAGKPLAYHRQNKWPRNGTEWLVQHRHGRLYPIEREVVAQHGNRFRLAHVFPTGPLSGSHWIVYHNDAYGPIAD